MHHLHLRPTLLLILLLTRTIACHTPHPPHPQNLTTPSVEAPAPATSKTMLWIRDVTVISPERPEPLHHAHVWVRSGRIVSVDEQAPQEPPPEATVIDGNGRFLVPGLIDAHVHLGEIPGIAHPAQAALPELTDAYFRQLPRSYLYFGFTTVIDLGNLDRNRLEEFRSAPVAPSVFSCGLSLPLANGYPMAFAPPEVRFDLFPNFLYDERQADSIPARFPPVEHTPEATVSRATTEGGICVKTYFEPGFGAQYNLLPTPTPELVTAVRTAAHQKNLPLLLHANSLRAHRFAVDVQVDAVVHGLWNWQTEPTGPISAAALPPPIRQVLDDEARSGIVMMPTLRVIAGLQDLFVPEFLADPHLPRVLPASLLQWYRSDDGSWFTRELAGDASSTSHERMRTVFQRVKEAGRAAATYFAANGGRLVFGSDTPSSPTYANPPGYNGYLEMQELERAGIPPTKIIEAATRSAAEFFGMAKDRGTIAPGQRADLLLLQADPSTSIRAFDSIELVIVGGKPIPRDELSVGS